MQAEDLGCEKCPLIEAYGRRAPIKRQFGANMRAPDGPTSCILDAMHCAKLGVRPTPVRPFSAAIHGGSTDSRMTDTADRVRYGRAIEVPSRPVPETTAMQRPGRSHLILFALAALCLSGCVLTYDNDLQNQCGGPDLLRYEDEPPRSTRNA